MKLVQLLAKELKEWPEGVSCMVQGSDGKICTCLNGFPDPYYGDWTICGPTSIDSPVVWADTGSNKQDLAHDQASAIITIEEWQAEREKMNKPKWIRHRGGNQPVEDSVKVEYKMRDGDISTQPEYAATLRWSHWSIEGDIMAYRIIEETKDQEIEEVKKTNFGTITYKLEIDATEATQRIDSLVEKWGQIVSPLKWRDEIIELEAYEEEFRREREKLIRKLESEGLKLIDHMAQVYGEQIIDMSDWRNWQAGDIVRVVANESSHSFDIGEEVVVSFIDDKDADLAVKAEYKDGRDFWWLAAKDAKFIRRP